MAVFSSLKNMIGNTPMLHAVRFCPQGNLFVKAEGFNPGGSAKDRAALYMLEDAKKRGLLKEGGSVIEPTSGNTGIGLAWLCAILGYKLTLTMPDTMSVERIRILKAYGADIVLTPGELGMQGAIDRANELKAELNAFMPMQFENSANALSHYETTAKEILYDMDGNIDAFVATVGTGGTLTGIARYLKENIPSVKIYAVEPSDSPVLSGGKAGPHKLQGIGAGFIPKVLDTSLIDEVITVSADDAYDSARKFAKTEGLLCGISSGAALSASMRVSGKRIVTLLPDTGERYLSTDLFEEV